MENLIGKTLSEAKQILKKNKITEVEVINNFTHEKENSTLLVTNYKVDKNKAKLYLGSFLLNL